MGRSLLPILIVALLMSLSSCSSGPPRISVHKDGTVNFAGKRKLTLTDFKVRLANYMRDNPAEEGPIAIEFKANDDTPILLVLQVKDALRKYHNSIRLELESSDGNTREEELLPALTSRENRSYEYVEPRNLKSIYLGAEGELFSDGGLTQRIAKEGLVQDLKSFIKSDPANPELPELKESFLPGVGGVQASKDHLIRVVPTSTTTYGWYDEISSLVDRAYDELWDEFSQEHFGHPFAEAQKNEEALLKMVYPRKIVEDPNVAGY